jgi:hypothetical protein
MKKVFFVLFCLLVVGIFSSESLAEEKTGIFTHFENLPISVECPEGCTFVQLYDGEKRENLFLQKYHPYFFFEENEGKEITLFFQKKEEKVFLLAIEFHE